ncbi:hypothetical protein [Paraburkholderia sp. C35]|uniref:hypothetical protein n=1 Tax=Paraburkholderia sp. C35 TaxID=2126993 RepID=UPI0013A5A059|nr:hypothetical protein [Paraburkholderia sp. C35]
MNLIRLVLFATVIAPTFAHAGCEDRLQAWTNQLHPGRKIATDFASCKAWPANPSLTLALLPLPQKGNSDDEGQYDLDILIADSNSGAIVAHDFQPSAITYDAIRLSSLSLDTARYQLTPTDRAFGVRTTQGNTSRVAPYETTALSLYVIDGTTVRRVLERLVIASNTGEWDGNCAGTFDTTTRTIDIGRAGSDGYAALKVSEKSEHRQDKVRGGSCDEGSPSLQRSSFTLEYRNGRYGVPKGLQAD